MTPEGKVKAQVKHMLRVNGCYQFWPVQSGYGTYTLDCLACHKGAFFAIETKAPKAKATVMQQALAKVIELAGGKTFVIDGTNLEELESWLSRPTA